MAYSSKRIGFDVGASRHFNIPESFICFTTNCLFHSSYGIISVCWYCLSLEDQTSTCFFVDAFSYYVCPEKSRNLRPGGQFRQLAPSRKTFWQWWQIEINHARRKIKWGVIGSLVEFAPIMFSSVGWQLLWNRIWSCILSTAWIQWQKVFHLNLTSGGIFMYKNKRMQKWFCHR